MSDKMIYAHMNIGRDEPRKCPGCGAKEGWIHAEDCIYARPDVIVAQPVRLYSHYFKDVSRLQKIDIYRVLELWQVTDPVFQHVAKKALVTGNRGHKDMDQDVQDMIDSLTRWQDMRKEESKSGT